jgi:hypothetical protein
MISKRKLMNWRKDALIQKQAVQALQVTHPGRFDPISPALIANSRILALTQELIDQQLVAGEQAKNWVRSKPKPKHKLKSSDPSQGKIEIVGSIPEV